MIMLTVGKDHYRKKSRNMLKTRVLQSQSCGQRLQPGERMRLPRGRMGVLFTMVKRQISVSLRN